MTDIPRTGPAGLRALLDAGPVFAGSSYDCLSARLLEDAGFACVVITGAGVAMSRLGLADLGLVTHTEMVDVARRITARAGVPIIADVDTGFGGVLNVARTFEEFGAAGVAAVHMEDQTFPKRCGHLTGKSVIDADEYLAKIRAADQARRGSEMLIIARTDAIAVEGLESAIDRGNRALAAGADVAFLEAPQSMEQIEEIGRRIDGRLMFNMVARGHSPAISFDELVDLGYDIAIVPPVAVNAAVHGIRQMAEAVLAARSDAPIRELPIDPVSLFEIFGLSEWLAIDEAAGTPGLQEAR